jgi:hypothetical protein
MWKENNITQRYTVMDLEKWTFLLTYRKEELEASGAILCQGTIELLHLLVAFVSDDMAFIVSFPGVL